VQHHIVQSEAARHRLLLCLLTHLQLISARFRFARPHVDGRRNSELFESNLLLAGLLPVRVEIVHNGATPWI